MGSNNPDGEAPIELRSLDEVEKVGLSLLLKPRPMLTH
jgi:hypothetical protein